MNRFTSFVSVSLAGCLGLFLGGCDGAQKGPSGSQPPPGTTDLGAAPDLPPAVIDLGPPDPYSWGEATPGVTVGPFSDLKLFRDGCSASLYARFIPNQNFDLLATVINTPAGLRKQVNYFTVPHFKDRVKVVQELGLGGFPAGSYTNDYTVRYPAGNQLTHSFTATPDNKMYRWPGIFTYVSDRMVGGDLFITVRSTINGTIGSCQIYDASDCPVSGLGFSTATAKVFIKGQDSEIHCAPAAQAGTRYLVVIQGLDVDQNNPFYATLDRP